jgi:hypothetical protein
VFKTEQEWKDVSPNAHSVNLTEHFKNLSIKVFKMVKFLQWEETDVELSNGQWQLLNKKCEGWLNDITMFTGEEAGSVVKRLGLVLYRIAITIIKKQITCVIETLLSISHCIRMFVY